MDAQEFEKKYSTNTRMSGEGIEGLTVHYPCPFCAEADWLVSKVKDAEKALSEGATCKSCGRGAKFVFTRELTGGGCGSVDLGVSFRGVQTCGDPPPDYVASLFPRES